MGLITLKFPAIAFNAVQGNYKLQTTNSDERRTLPLTLKLGIENTYIKVKRCFSFRQVNSYFGFLFRGFFMKYAKEVALRLFVHEGIQQSVMVHSV